MPDSLERHLAAVMFTDIQGYTALMQRDEHAALVSRRRHRGVLEEVVSSHGGRVLQYFGDGSLAIFMSAVNAVSAAVEVQHSLSEPPRIPLRIGLHVGDIAYDEEGAYGDAVNIASRLESLSPPGGVLLSGRLYLELLNKPGIRVEHVGTAKLKNVAEPIELYAVALEGISIPSFDPELLSEGLIDALSPGARAALDRSLAHAPYRPPARGALPRDVPLVGREQDLELLRALLSDTLAGRGATAVIRGERGVGKSRLAECLAEEARAVGWRVALSRAYPAERRVPFAPFTDAFHPILSGLEPEDVSALAGGAADLLGYLFPSLGPPEPRAGVTFADPTELQTRVFWQFFSMLVGLASRRPLMVILEDLQWADPSSVDLLHFLARHSATQPILFVGLYSDPDPERREVLRHFEQSLAAIHLATVLEVGPLSPADVERLVCTTFGVAAAETQGFIPRLYSWTRGNPFFVEGILRGLVESGTLYEADGAWRGWDVEELHLPRSVRDAVLVRIARLDPDARRLVEALTVLGNRAPHGVLSAVSGIGSEQLIAAVEQLEASNVVAESETDRTVVYDFVHPLIGEAIRSEWSLGRKRELHANVAQTLEAYYGGDLRDHADELAYHYGRAPGPRAASKAIAYLTVAGKRALARQANREAASCLQDALDRLDAAGAAALRDDAGVDSADLMRSLAKAKARPGEAETARRLLRRALSRALDTEDHVLAARIHREAGLALLWNDRLEEAGEEFWAGLSEAQLAKDEGLVARLQLVKGIGHHYAGEGAEAVGAIRSALETAERLHDLPLLARAHSSRLSLIFWTGDLATVREHGREALRLADRIGAPAVAFWSHWTIAVAEGLFGHIGDAGKQIALAKRTADEIGSPVLRLWAAELSVEHAYSTGDWDTGIELGEKSIELARSLHQKTLLPRLLVWTSLIHGGRGNFARVEEMVDEAWDVSEAHRAAEGSKHVSVHTVIPAHIGRAAFHCALDEWDEAIRIAQIGVELADRAGYVIWGLHRLLPILGEAYLHSRQLNAAREIVRRVRAVSEPIGHELGLVRGRGRARPYSNGSRASPARAWTSCAELPTPWTGSQ